MVLPVAKVSQNSPQIAVVDSVAYGPLWCGNSIVIGLSFAFVPRWRQSRRFTPLFSPNVRTAGYISQSYIYTTANIIRSREPSATKHFLIISFSLKFFPIQTSLTDSFQKIDCPQKKNQTMHCKLRWHLEINGQSSHTFFSAMGRRLGLLPCLNGGLGYLVMYLIALRWKKKGERYRFRYA